VAAQENVQKLKAMLAQATDECLGLDSFYLICVFNPARGDRILSWVFGFRFLLRSWFSQLILKGSGRFFLHENDIFCAKCWAIHHTPYHFYELIAKRKSKQVYYTFL